MTTERKGAVLFGGRPMTLVGPELKVGDTLPDVELVDQTMAHKKISSVKAVVKIVSGVVSLDTGVCAMETKRFEEEVGKLGAAVALITVSRDLPFAQQRFCGGTPPAYALFLSDYKDASFGKAYGT
ncbi:MAG: redoxin family protein, partial [Candidatus Micrarchaeota archaeon]|nr:redoxin family protein [Candidatus Micrarchaeota archaeon]